jgi:hypothetical protein
MSLTAIGKKTKNAPHFSPNGGPIAPLGSPIDPSGNPINPIAHKFRDLTKSALDEGGIAIARAKVLNIEKELIEWVKEHQNSASIMQPEESALVLIDDLRNSGF